LSKYYGNIIASVGFNKYKKHMTKLKLILLSVVILALIAAGVFFFVIQKPGEQSNQKLIFKMGYQNVIGNLPIYVAQENGWLETDKWKIELIQMASSNQVNDALLTHQIDFSGQMGVFVPLLTQISNPDQIKIFATMDITKEHPVDGIVVKSSSDIQNLSDLRSKKVGVYPGVSATNQLKLLLQKQNIDSSSIEFVPLAPNLQFQALASGSIDALFSYEPLVTNVLEKGDYRQVFGSVFAEVYNHSPGGVWVVTTKTASEHPGETKEITQMFQKAYEYTEKNQTTSREIAQQRFDLSESVAKKVPLSKTVFLSEIKAEVIQGYADLLFDLGELKQRVKTDDMIYKSEPKS